MLAAVLSCGAGTSFAGASRAILFEPQWSTMREAQIICRVYRVLSYPTTAQPAQQTDEEDNAVTTMTTTQQQQHESNEQDGGAQQYTVKDHRRAVTILRLQADAPLEQWQSGRPLPGMASASFSDGDDRSPKTVYSAVFPATTTAQYCTKRQLLHQRFPTAGRKRNGGQTQKTQSQMTATEAGDGGGGGDDEGAESQQMTDELSVPVELEEDAVMCRALALSIPYIGSVDLESNEDWLQQLL